MYVNVVPVSVAVPCAGVPSMMTGTPCESPRSSGRVTGVSSSVVTLTSVIVGGGGARKVAVTVVVAGQELLGIDVEREQVANRVSVFRTGEAVKRRESTRIRPGRGHTVEIRLELRGHRILRRVVWTRQTSRRHRATPKPSHHLFPCLRSCPWCAWVDRVELQASRAQFFVVAGNTVLIDDVAMRGRRHG